MGEKERMAAPIASDLSREEALHVAKLAEQAERYDEMVQYMKRIVQLGVQGDELSVEERNLISVGYKNKMSMRRTAWRTVQQLEDKEKEINSDRAPLYKAYRQTIADEIYELIDQVIQDIVQIFTEGPQKATDVEVLVFFQKMEGDYYRYGAEISQDDTRTMYKEKARKAYSAAQELADQQLPSTNPIRLGLALNFSVFFYEICEEKKQASELAKTAFDTAIDDLDTLPEDAYKDSTLIMQLLKDNLTLWNDEYQDDDIAVEEMND